MPWKIPHSRLPDREFREKLDVSCKSALPSQSTSISTHSPAQLGQFINSFIKSNFVNDCSPSLAVIHRHHSCSQRHLPSGFMPSQLSTLFRMWLTNWYIQIDFPGGCQGIWNIYSIWICHHRIKHIIKAKLNCTCSNEIETCMYV